MVQEKSQDDAQIYELIETTSPLRQGEILTNVIQIVLDLETIHDEKPRITKIGHPFAVIVSQDWDLDWDFKVRQKENENNSQLNNKDLPNILLCMAISAEELRKRDSNVPKGGTREINSTSWNEIRKNKHERYQFLQKIPASQDTNKEGIPELGVDFKRYFTVPATELYLRFELGEVTRRCKLRSPYLEHFTSRFYYFQSRVALPEDHFSE